MLFYVRFERQSIVDHFKLKGIKEVLNFKKKLLSERLYMKTVVEDILTKLTMSILYYCAILCFECYGVNVYWLYFMFIIFDIRICKSARNIARITTSENRNSVQHFKTAIA